MVSPTEDDQIVLLVCKNRQNETIAVASVAEAMWIISRTVLQPAESIKIMQGTAILHYADYESTSA